MTTNRIAGFLGSNDRAARKETAVKQPASIARPPICPVQIHWMIRRDMPEYMEIEQQSFAHPWTEEDFLCCLRQRNCIGMVCRRDDKAVGFMVYELLKSQLHILNFAVAIGFRRQGVGRQMVDKLVAKLTQQRRHQIRVEVRDGNLSAQLFWQAMGFRATNVIHGHYEDSNEDAIAFLFDLRNHAGDDRDDMAGACPADEWD